MATKIGSVVIDIDARLTSLEANLAKATKRFDRFDKDMRRTGGQIEASFTRLNGVVLNFVKGLGAGLIAGALSGGAKSLLNFADDLATAADQANVSVERFQTLRGAFRSLEIDGDVYEKILQKLIVAQGEVASGAENATTKALDKLGISAKILSGEITTTDGFVDALAISLGNIEDPAQKAAIAADIVSKRYGTQLAAALGDGGKALHQAEVDFTNAGKVIDDVMIQKLAAANETWDGFVENIQSKSVIMAASVIDAFGKIQDAYLKWGAEFVLDNTWLYDEEKQQIAQDILIKQHREYLNKLADDQKRVADKLASVKLPALDWINPKTAIKPDPNPDPKGARTTGSTKPTFSPADLRLGNDLPPVELPISLDVDRPLVDLDKMNVGLEGLRQRVTAADIALADTFDVELFDRVQQIGDAFEQDIARSLADVLVYSDNLGDALESAFKRMASAMLEAVIQAQVLKPLLESMGFSSGGGAFTNLFGGFFADGGRPPMGKVSVVGERGPELFVPDLAGRILPNDVFANMGGGSRVEVVPSPYFDVRVSDISGQVAASTVARAAPAIVNGSVGAVRQGMRRNRRFLG